MSLQDDIARLTAALNRGQRVVQFKDRKVEYASMEEMRTRLRELEAQARNTRSFRAVTTSGTGTRGY